MDAWKMQKNSANSGNRRTSLSAQWAQTNHNANVLTSILGQIFTIVVVVTVAAVLFDYRFICVNTRQC